MIEQLRHVYPELKSLSNENLLLHWRAFNQSGQEVYRTNRFLEFILSCIAKGQPQFIRAEIGEAIQELAHRDSATEPNQ